jgi:CrcB protein
MSLLYIALGGGLGAVLRFLLTEYVNNNISNFIPLGTLSVNVLGCFIVGCIAGFFASKSSPMYFFFVIGFLGSFTTMSAFSIQTIELFNSNIVSGITYVILTFSFTIVATYLGLTVFSK